MTTLANSESLLAEINDQINICICTCRRINLLELCLNSLIDIEVPLHVAISVTVVDNDGDASAQTLVQSLQAEFPFPLYYVKETRSGIPFARNRAIEESLTLNSDYLVFIDDDEWVEPNWLLELYGYCRKRGGEAIVSGDVIQELPDSASDQVRSFFRKRYRETGTELTACATNNVMIPFFVCRDLGLRFDEKNPHMGGEDTVFFTLASHRGVPIYKCAEALVHETIPESRANMRWLARRKFRVGVIASWRKRQQGRLRVRILISALLVVLVELMKSAVCAVFLQASMRNKYWLRACKYTGVFCGVFGARLDEYKVIHGS